MNSVLSGLFMFLGMLFFEVIAIAVCSIVAYIIYVVISYALYERRRRRDTARRDH